MSNAKAGLGVRIAAFAVLLTLPLAGCGEKKAQSVEAAERLAEALYPGRLEVYGTRWRVKYDGGYDVTFAVKGDPVTRIRLAVDADPSQCVPGSRCETALRDAYDYGVAQGQELKALDRGFRTCGVPVLQVASLQLQKPPKSPQSVAAQATVAIELTTSTRAAAQARFVACTEAWGRERAGAPWSDRVAFLTLSIIPTGASRPSPPETLTLETRASSGDRLSAVYQQGVRLEGQVATPLALTFAPPFEASHELDKALSAAAKAFLANQPGAGRAHLRGFRYRTALDPVRVEVIRIYMLACSEWTGKPSCVSDLAIRMRYDLTSRTASDFELLRDVRDARGNLVLPQLPGR